MTNPWWFSGSDRLGEGGADEPEQSGGGQQGGQGHDLLSMLAGAQRMVAWAAEAVLAPHAEHADPREHPQCLLCRGALLLGDVGVPGFGADAAGSDLADSMRTAAQAPAQSAAEPITWLHVHR